MYYLWSLRIYDDANDPRLLSEHYYRDQAFQVPLREKTRPTLRESFDLQPGTYQVQVCLHRLPEGFDFDRLADKAVLQPMLVLSPVSKVTVAN
jgi:hypothetical protein